MTAPWHTARMLLSRADVRAGGGRNRDDGDCADVTLPRLSGVEAGKRIRTPTGAMLTFLLANGGRTRRSSNEVAQAMLELQARAEAGERTDQLVSWLSNLLSR